MRMKKNYLLGMTTLLVTLGLAGCTNNKSASSTTINEPTSAKVTHHAAKTEKAGHAEAATNQAQVASAQSASVRAKATSDYQVPVVKAPAAQTSAKTASAVTTPTTKANNSQTAAKDLPANPAVLQQFLAASGVKEQAGNAYAITKQADGSYQVEVRHTGANQDQNVANLTGLYHYNPSTNQVQQMDPVSGEFVQK